MIRLFTLIAAGMFSAALLAPTASLAEPAIATKVVRTADLDLSSAGGQATLKRRLGAAAEAVCGETSAVDPVGRRQIRQCRAEIIHLNLERLALARGPERLAERSR